MCCNLTIHSVTKCCVALTMYRTYNPLTKAQMNNGSNRMAENISHTSHTHKNLYFLENNDCFLSKGHKTMNFNTPLKE